MTLNANAENGSSMSEADFDRLKVLTKKWTDSGINPQVTFIGVDTGHRETLRNHISFPIEIH